MKRTLWGLLFFIVSTLGVLSLSSCSSSKPKKEVVRDPLGVFLQYTLLYQSGRQGTFVPGQGSTTPFGGLDREANAVEFIRSQPTMVLYADGGNLFLPDSFDNGDAEELEKRKVQSGAIVEALNLMSLDVFAPGPTDWKLGREHLVSLSKQAVFKFVATNIMDASGRRIFPAFQLVRRGEYTFAFLGISPEGWFTSEAHATNVATALNKWVWQAAVRSDFVIVLSQLADLAEDKKILERYPQVKMVIGNDPRRTLEVPEWVRGRLLLDGYRHGYFLGKMTFDVVPPFFGFYSEPLLRVMRQKREGLERELASEQDVEKRAKLQENLVVQKANHPESRPSGASRFIHELIPLDKSRFGRPNEVTAFLTPKDASPMSPGSKEDPAAGELDL